MRFKKINMSIFSQDLDKGGTLRDVIQYCAITYPNGKSIYSSPIPFKETVSFEDEAGVGHCINCDPSNPYFDTESEYVLFEDGFFCNLGKINYEMIFNKGIPHINYLPEAILSGHIETLYVPYQPSWGWEFGGMDRFLKEHPGCESRLIRFEDWWDLVESSIKEGIENSINKEFDVNVSVTRAPNPISIAIDYSRRSFYVTLHVRSHNTYGNIFWPEDREDKLCGLYEIKDTAAIYAPVCIRTGRPINISVKIELKYKLNI